MASSSREPLGYRREEADGFRKWTKLVPSGRREDGPYTESLLRELWNAGNFIDRLADALAHRPATDALVAETVARTQERISAALEALNPTKEG